MKKCELTCMINYPYTEEMGYMYFEEIPRIGETVVAHDVYYTVKGVKHIGCASRNEAPRVELVLEEARK